MASTDSLQARLGREDAIAGLQMFALVAVLAFLPNRPIGWLAEVNPRKVWLVVVFVAGLSFVGYLASKVVTPGTALGLAGGLGGLVSPGLAVTSLLEQRSRAPAFERAYAFAASVAVTGLFARNIVVVAAVSTELAASLLVPFAGMAAVALVVAAAFWVRLRDADPPPQALETPFRLRNAFLIGAVVAAILALANTLDVSVPRGTTEIGIVLVTLVQLSVYTIVTRSAGAREMAKAIGATLLGGAAVGLGLVLV